MSGQAERTFGNSLELQVGEAGTIPQRPARRPRQLHRQHDEINIGFVAPMDVRRRRTRSSIRARFGSRSSRTDTRPSRQAPPRRIAIDAMEPEDADELTSEPFDKRRAGARRTKTGSRVLVHEQRHLRPPEQRRDMPITERRRRRPIIRRHTTATIQDPLRGMDREQNPIVAPPPRADSPASEGSQTVPGASPANRLSETPTPPSMCRVLRQGPLDIAHPAYRRPRRSSHRTVRTCACPLFSPDPLRVCRSRFVFVSCVSHLGVNRQRRHPPIGYLICQGGLSAGLTINHLVSQARSDGDPDLPSP